MLRNSKKEAMYKGTSRQQLIERIKAKKSFLCVGLDTDLDKIPTSYLKADDPIFEFNKDIVDATKDYCVAYKPNLAFYEQYGAKGWESLQKTIDYIPQEQFVIADAKRGDIGNTSEYYAKSFFEIMNCDAVTVAPYMGHDSVTPFFKFENRWVILLAMTSNQGALDFQFLSNTIDNKPLWRKVVEKSAKWGTEENMMYVVGATRPEMLADIRKISPKHFFLVPGVGAQGGTVEEVSKYGMNEDCGLLVNSSRGIIYASSGDDAMNKAEEAAKALQSEMEIQLRAKGII